MMPCRYAPQVPKREPQHLRLAVDRASPVPLYFQLARQLETAIEEGALSPGSLLGNEIELAARLGLSRPTVRQAIQSLVDKGLLVRRRGIGTQVVRGSGAHPLVLSSLYDDLLAAGLQPTTRVLHHTRVPASAEVAAALDLPESCPVVEMRLLRLTRRRADGVSVQLPAVRSARTARRGTGVHRPLRADAALRRHLPQRPAERGRPRGDRRGEPHCSRNPWARRC